MNTFRRIPRYMVKALAAGAVMVAAALPMAVATEAGAATTPGTISAVSVTGTTVVQGRLPEHHRQQRHATRRIGGRLLRFGIGDSLGHHVAERNDQFRSYDGNQHCGWK
jgi:hypothetical protein